MEDEQKELIIQQLRDSGCRITKQRRIILDIILNGDPGCSKEIYREAIKIDKNIGSATVYRMINTLEEIGVINRKNMYQVDCSNCKSSCIDELCEISTACNGNCGKNCECSSSFIVGLLDGSNIEITTDELHMALTKGLKETGILESGMVTSIRNS